MKIEESRFNVMQEDFAFRRNRPDEMIYRPDYKPAVELQLDTKVAGLKGVTDFDIFDVKIKKKKQQNIDQSRIIQQQRSMNESGVKGI